MDGDLETRPIPEERGAATSGVSGVLRRVGLGVVVGVILFLVAAFVWQIFGGFWIQWSNEMDNQPSVGYVEPPPLSAAADAIPFQGLDLAFTLGSSSNPVTPNQESRDRGKSDYAIFCAVCHGEPGTNKPGEVGLLFVRQPPDLKAMAAALPPSQVFQVISDGFGVMPALGAKVLADERWDMVNYLRGLTPGLTPAPVSNPDLRAAAIFTTQCASCHGATAGGALGPALYPSPFLSQSTNDQIIERLRAGIPGHVMLSFAGRLTSDDLSALAGMLKTLQQRGPQYLEQLLTQLQTTTTTTAATTTTMPPTTTTTGPTTTTTAPPGTTTTTGGDQALIAQGRQAYTANCQSCHGADGAGGIGPRLQPNAQISSSPDSVVRGIIENGVQGTAMPAWRGRLTDAQITAVVALLRSWQQPSPSANTAEGVPESTLPFAHDAHASKGISCQFCHSAGRHGPAQDLPSLELCAGCHRSFTVQSDQTRQVVAAFDDSREISWPRAFRVPDFVYFTHRSHLILANIGCGRCHGDIAEQGLAKGRRLTMGFCLECHQKLVTPMKRLADCDVCHK